MLSKYNKSVQYEESLPNPIVNGEEVIWSAKPKKRAFIINAVFGMLPLALFWLIFDLMFIGPIVLSGAIWENLSFFVIFFGFHLLPVWIWIGNIVTANTKWKNTKYYVTDKRIIIQTGIIGASYQTIYYKDIKNVNLKVGLIDKMLGVGDIYIDTGVVRHTRNGLQSVFYTLLDVENPYDIYPKVQKIVMDIQTDTYFPNAYRPDENPGYNTKYNGK